MSEEQVPYAVSVYEPDDAAFHLAAKIFDRPILFHRVFVELTGNIMSALMLSQAMWWTRNPVSKKRDGWFYKTQDEWQQETGMNRYQQDKAREILRGFSFWQEKREGLPAKMWYRVNQNALMREISSLSKVSKLECSPSANSIVEGEQTLQKNTTKEHNKEESSSEFGEICAAYESNIGLLTPMIGDKIKDAMNDYPTSWILEGISEATGREKRSWNYVLGCLKNWKREGKSESTDPKEEKKQVEFKILDGDTSV